MRAVTSDELLVRGRHVGDVDREGVIVEVHGEDGAAPSGCAVMPARWTRRVPWSMRISAYTRCRSTVST